MSFAGIRPSAKARAEIKSVRGGIAAFLLMSGCAGMTAIGAGCSAYAEARLTMPPLGVDAVSLWVADLDDRMTGVCTG